MRHVSRMGDGMKLLILFGSGAVGKMTVGQELMRITDLRLFHNHMMIEPVLEIFGGYHSRAVARLREVVFEEFAASGQYGLIFTYMWALDEQSDWDYIAHLREIFAPYDTEVYFAELIAPQSVRLLRNGGENRLLHKPSKRDRQLSDARLQNEDASYRLVSREGEFAGERYLKIDNSNLTAAEAAQKIKAYFGFTKEGEQHESDHAQRG